MANKIVARFDIFMAEEAWWFMEHIPTSIVPDKEELNYSLMYLLCILDLLSIGSLREMSEDG